MTFVKNLALAVCVCAILAPLSARAVTGDAAITQMQRQRAELQTRLDALKRSGNDKDGTVNSTKKGWINAAGVAIGGIGGGVLAYQAVRSVQKAQAEGAAKDWLENVGKHIKCYIGAEEVGEYGDVISTEMN